jgi:prophage regulatory protein
MATQSQATIHPDALLRTKKVVELTGLHRVTLWRWCRTGRFPSPVQIGEKAVAWRAAEVLAWIAARPVVARAAEAGADRGGDPVRRDRAGGCAAGRGDTDNQ